MSILKNLKFAELPARSRDPVANYRAKIIERLEEQKLLLANPSHVRVSNHYRGKGEARKLVEQTQKVRPWFRTGPTGVFFSVFKGSTPLEFQKGKPAIAVSSKDELPALIDAVITAAKAGELDEMIKAAMAKSTKVVGGTAAPKVKRAA